MIVTQTQCPQWSVFTVQLHFWTSGAEHTFGLRKTPAKPAFWMVWHLWGFSLSPPQVCCRRHLVHLSKCKCPSGLGLSYFSHVNINLRSISINLRHEKKNLTAIEDDGDMRIFHCLRVLENVSPADHWCNSSLIFVLCHAWVEPPHMVIVACRVLVEGSSMDHSVECRVISERK